MWAAPDDSRLTRQDVELIVQDLLRARIGSVVSPRSLTPTALTPSATAGQVLTTVDDSTGSDDPVAGWTTPTWRFPVGGILSWAGSSASVPSRWLLCYGQEVSRTTYSELFAVIGTTYGVGDGSTTFNVPDLRGRVEVGLDNMGGVDAGRLSAANTLGGTGGAETVALGVAELPGHTHNAGTLAGPAHTHGAGTLVIPTHTHSGTNTLVVDSHTHGAGTLVIPAHTHNAGTLAGPSHSHAASTGTGTLAIPSHTHTFGTIAVSIASDNAFTATQTGTGVNRANASHTHTATVSGSTGSTPSATAVTGSTDAGGTGSVTGSTGSTISANAVTGSTGTASVATVSGATGSTISANAVTGSTASDGTGAVTGSTGSTLSAAGAAATGHANLQPYILTNKIIYAGDA